MTPLHTVPFRIARREEGVTLIEASIILAVVAVLSAVLAPSVNGYIEQARQARVRGDVKTIADAINDFITDNGEHQFLIDGKGDFAEEPPTRPDANRVNLLVSDGDTPPYQSALGATEAFWAQPVNLTTVDTLANHLVQNTPGDDAFGDLAYRNANDIAISGGGNNIDFARADSSGFNAPYAWRGPYLRGPVDADPWGNRYAVNVAFLDPAPTAALANVSTAFQADAGAYPRLDVFVLSAGPDEEIDTLSAQDGAVPGDDDFIHLVSSHAK